MTEWSGNNLFRHFRRFNTCMSYMSGRRTPRCHPNEDEHVQNTKAGHHCYSPLYKLAELEACKFRHCDSSRK